MCVTQWDHVSNGMEPTKRGLIGHRYEVKLAPGMIQSLGPTFFAVCDHEVFLYTCKFLLYFCRLIGRECIGSKASLTSYFQFALTYVVVVQEGLNFVRMLM